MVQRAKLKKLLPLSDRGILKKQGNDGKFPPLPCDSAGGTPAPVLLIFVLVEEEQGIQVLGNNVVVSAFSLIFISW